MLGAKDQFILELTVVKFCFHMNWSFNLPTLGNKWFSYNFHNCSIWIKYIKIFSFQYIHNRTRSQSSQTNILCRFRKAKVFGIDSLTCSEIDTRKTESGAVLQLQVSNVEKNHAKLRLF